MLVRLGQETSHYLNIQISGIWTQPLTYIIIVLLYP
jgi:hypothetical protein